MQKTIAASDFEGAVHSVLDEVADGHVAYVLTRNRRPAAAVVPYEEYERFKVLSENEVLRRFEATRADIQERAIRLQFTDEEIAADIATARREISA